MSESFLNGSCGLANFSCAGTARYSVIERRIYIVFNPRSTNRNEIQHNDSSCTLDVMLEQRAKTAQTPKAAVGQLVIINKSLQHSDNRRWRYLGDGFKTGGKTGPIIFCKVLIC